MKSGADDRVWPLVTLSVVLGAGLALAILASALAGLLGHADPIWISPAQAGTLLAQLVSHLSDPARAWPAADRPDLPGTAELQAVLVISLIAVAAACLFTWRLARRLRDATPRQAVREMGDPRGPCRASRPSPRAGADHTRVPPPRPDRR